MTVLRFECLTCGYPNLRPAGHASFCAPHNEREAAHIRCGTCGLESNVAGLGSHYRANPDHRLPAVAVASGSDGPATVVEPGASGAAGSSSGKSGTPAASTHAKTPRVAARGVQNTAAR